MSDNLFSIVIPTRQRHDTLKYAIQSVINQSYKDFELIVMDNFSTTETAEVVAEFSDARIKYYRAPERLSMSDNWELGLSHTTGEYVFVLGDDDALMPDGLDLALRLISEYNVDIVSWWRYSYGWPNAIVPWIRNRLQLNLLHHAEFWNSKKKLKEFYNYQLAHEFLPMVYNSFVRRNIIDSIKSIYGKYFMSSTMAAAPDVYSGIVNAYFTDRYLYSFRSISVIGSSGHSIGASVCFPSLNSEPLKDVIKDEKKDGRSIFHHSLVPTTNGEIGAAHLQLRTKELFFPNNTEIDVNIENLLNFVAGCINRDPGTYEKTLKDIEAIAQKHGISVATLNIPDKLTNLNTDLEAYQGLIYTSDGVARQLIINCEQVGISNVAQAVKLAHGILPRMESLVVINAHLNKFTQEEELHLKDKKYKENEQPVPRILVDGVFYQLYQTGIGRVWQSVLEEWVENGFAKHIIFLDRGGTAPKIPGVWYRQMPLYNYNNMPAEREMLQHICDEEGADLFISTYYTTPTTTPSVFVAYDMIPEVMGWDLDSAISRHKHLAIQQACGYITISENTARDLKKFFPDISSESITVAHCGVKSSFTPASVEEINSFKIKYGINKPYFLLVGGGGYKNTTLFLQAFAQLYSRQDFEIVSTSKAPLEEEDFKAYTAGSVVHLLQLSDEELRVAYSGAVALVYPSTYEGFGLPILEAIACGCPVITCPNASIPEVAGEAALYISDRDVDALTNALYEVQKPDVRKSLKAAGLEQAKKFSWSKMASTVSSVFINATLLRLNLREINYIVFPDWTQPEESLGIELQRVISAIATHPDSSRITLLIDTSNIADEEEANLLLSSIALNLLMEEDIDVTEGLEISLLGQLGAIQWKALLPRIQTRIVLENENKGAITQARAENLPFRELDSMV
jgi:glycosyltransferase involved in cell wall biosynthesis